MTPEQRIELKDLLTRSCEAVIADGKKITTGTFGFVGSQCFCPIGAACIDMWHVLGGYHGMLSKKIGFEVSDLDMYAFIDGFDGGTHRQPRHDQDPELFVMGQEFREKYIKG